MSKRIRNGLSPISRRLGVLLATGLCAIVSHGPTGAADPDPELGQHYGFLPVEVFKLPRRAGNLLAAPLNAGKAIDLVAVDNSRSRLELMLQRSQPKDTNLTDELPNEVSDDWRFERHPIAVNSQVAAMTAGDFDSDGRVDLAYFGVPDQLVVSFQPESGEWTRRIRRRVPGVQPRLWTLAAGDLNGDKQTDLVLIGTKVTYLFYQREGRLQAPERLLNTAEQLGLVHTEDLDGDGRNDLSYLANDDPQRSLCVRFQSQTGSLGPELRFPLRFPRAYRLANIDETPAVEILTIDGQSNRLHASSIRRPQPDPDRPAEQLIQFGYGSGDSRQHDMATGDVDGDGLVDVVISDPNQSRTVVFRQSARHGLDQGTSYPGLLGAEHVQVANVEPHHPGDEVVVLSQKEQTLGISRFQSGRLTFPQPLPVVGEPSSLAVMNVSGDDGVEIAYTTRIREGGSSHYELRALVLNEKEWEPIGFGEAEAIQLNTRGAAPKRLTVADVNGDGRSDLFVSVGFDRSPHLLVQNETGGFDEAGQAGGFRLGAIRAGGLYVGGAAKDRILVAQKNFARELKLQDGKWQVVDQFNADESEAEIAGAAAIDVTADGEPEIVLVDTGIKKLRFLRNEDNVFRPWREVEIGNFPFQGIQTVDLNGDRRDDLLLWGRGRFGILFTGQTDPQLEVVASYESSRRRAFFSDVAAGDLNDDGLTDVALIDSRSGAVEILHYHPGSGLRAALTFRIFERKTFTESAQRGVQPRESITADVTNDGRDDLVLLVHDRLLVYPQDDGSPILTEKKEATVDTIGK